MFEAANILLTESRNFSEPLLSQALLLPEPFHVSADQSAHVHAHEISGLHILSLSTIICMTSRDFGRMSKNIEIRCESCGTLNRVSPYSIRQIPKCGRCKGVLRENLAFKLLRELYQSRSHLLRLLLIASPLLFLAWVAFRLPSPNNLASTANNQCVGRPQPREGIYRWYGPDWGSDLAELTIKISVGTNYFIRLEDLSGRPARTYFMRGGATETFPVPLGTFKLKYAVGSEWCGDSQLFGSDTIYNVTDDSFTFEETPDHYPTHWTVELILQPHGNLRTQQITRADFDGAP